MSDAPLADLADEFEAWLEDATRAAGTYSDDPQNWHARHRLEMATLAQRLADTYDMRVVTSSSQGTRLRLRGIATSSTSGLHQALRHWINRAREAATAA
jgi:hypothetical protein